MGFFILIACQLLGEGLRTLLHLPVPGPVVGLFILAAALVLRRRSAPRARGEADVSLERTSNLLITHMGLLFVPAGVGVVTEATLIRGAWLPLTLALLGSTLATLLVTGSVMQLITKMTEKRASHAARSVRAEPALSAQGHR